MQTSGRNRGINTAFCALRVGLAKHFCSECVDVIKGIEFNKAIDMFLLMSFGLKRDRLGIAKHTPAIETDEVSTI